METAEQISAERNATAAMCGASAVLVPRTAWQLKARESRHRYLSPIIDCFNGMVMSWTIGTSPDAELVNTMLEAAIETVMDTADRPVVHSDRGGHYRWPGWLSRMSDAKLTRSMSGSPRFQCNK